MKTLSKKTLHKLTLAAGLATAGATGGHAQSVGAACGCPNLGSRTPVTIQSGTIVDASGNLLSGTTTLTCNNLYTLDSRLYVGDGQDLYIEPGTVIKATNASPARAIIVSRGGQIWANGSESCPIIMTAAADPLNGSYAVTNRGQWGSLIILGRAYNNVRQTDVASPSLTGTDGVGLIEGLTAGDPRHFYGMPVGQEINNDNSGVLRYVSLRHGGQIIGAANEINGLTMGSVGSGTTIEHVEVIANLDDGFEWFGGTVNCKHLVAMHCDDDYFDWDQGYSGKLQFLYGVQGPDNSGGANNQGDNGFEMDGDDHATNFGFSGVRSNPTVYNATIIGRNVNDEALEAKERTLGTVANSVFARFQQGLNLTTEVETFWNASTFNVKNCTFQGVTNPLRINGVNQTSGTAFDKFIADGNLIAAAQSLIDATYNMPLPGNAISGNDRINPVPTAGTATTTLAPPVDGFFSGAKYRGAFEPGAEPWTQKWTLASQIGSDVSTVAGCVGDLNKDGVVNSDDFGLFVNAFNGTCY